MDGHVARCEVGVDLMGEIWLLIYCYVSMHACVNYRKVADLVIF